jgi:hypothetical protein
MSDADEAYKAAERKIAVARERSDTELDFDSAAFLALDRLPPGIGTLDRLEVLRLRGTQVADITPLQDLGNLQTLGLTETRVADIAPVRGLGNLQRLYLSGTRVADIAPLQGLGNLQGLDLDRTRVADLAPLAGVENLQTLNLRGTRVADVTPLQGLENLELLGLSATQVADITPLQGLGNLQGLVLSDTQVADIARLQDLENLRWLALSDTQIADIAPLQGLGNLQGLVLSDTQVADLRPIANLPQLGDGASEGLRFTDTPAARATPELTRLSQIEDDQDRTRETLAYLKTLPPWPDPLPWAYTDRPAGGDTGAVVKTAQAQIAFLLEHAAASQVAAETTASQIRHALREVPATDGNKLPPVLQTMLDVAAVLDRLAAAPIGPDKPDREAELTARIAELEERVQTLTAHLADAESAREAAEALANTTGFWPNLRVAAGTSIGKQAGPLIHTGILSGTVYFLGTNHTFVQGLLRAIEALK